MRLTSPRPQLNIIRAIFGVECHPGGDKVITALERALSLEQGALDHERTVLADFGNMSAPTALFVLERLIQAGLPSRTLLSAMGPGFSVSSVSLRRAA